MMVMVMMMMLLQKWCVVWWKSLVEPHPMLCSAGGGDGGGGGSGDTTHQDIIIVACCCCCSRCEAHLTYFALGPSPRPFLFGCFLAWELCTVKSADDLCYSSLHFHYDTLLTYSLLLLVQSCQNSSAPDTDILVSCRWVHELFLNWNKLLWLLLFGASWTRCNDIYKILGVFLSRLDLGLDFGVGLREEERDHLLIVFGYSLYSLFSLFPFFCVLSIRKEGRKACGGEIRERTLELKLHICCSKGNAWTLKRKRERWRWWWW